MEKKSVSFYTADILKGATHGFFTRQGGVSRPPYDTLSVTFRANVPSEEVEENKKIAMDALGVPETIPYFLHQIHSAQAVLAEKSDKDIKHLPQADGMVTTDPAVTLCIQTADCGPVLFYDGVNQVIGAAHAGWRGAINGVLESTLDLMVQQGAEKSSIQVAIGPCVHMESYEVGAEFKQEFLQHHPKYEAFFHTLGAQIHFDLPGFITYRLQEAGITRIENIGEDTYSQPHTFFSCRWAGKHGDGHFGGNLSAITLDVGK